MSVDYLGDGSFRKSIPTPEDDYNPFESYLINFKTIKYTETKEQRIEWIINESSWTLYKPRLL